MEKNAVPNPEFNALFENILIAIFFNIFDFLKLGQLRQNVLDPTGSAAKVHAVQKVQYINIFQWYADLLRLCSPAGHSSQLHLPVRLRVWR